MADEPKQETPAPPTPDAGGNSGTLTQEQVNAIIAERVKRAEEATTKKMLESLGVQSADEIKAVLEAKKQADEAAKTELQKLADKATKAETDAAALKAEYEGKLAGMAKRLLDSEIKQAAGRAVEKDGKVSRPAFRPEALDDILVLIDRAGIEDKDGKYEGIEKALENLAKSKPYLLADGKAPAQAKGTPPGGQLPSKPAQQQPEQTRPRISL